MLSRYEKTRYSNHPPGGGHPIKFKSFFSEMSHSAEFESLNPTSYLYLLQNLLAYIITVPLPHLVRNVTHSDFVQNWNIMGSQLESSTKALKPRQPIRIEYRNAENIHESSGLWWNTILGSGIESLLHISSQYMWVFHQPPPDQLTVLLLIIFQKYCFMKIIHGS